jgi:lysophospholipase L1-like esterase
VFVAAARLRSDGYSVTVTNRGIPTATISVALQQLGLQYGHFIAGNILDGQLPFVPRESTVVTVFAGGNDVNVIMAAVGGGAGGANQAAFIDQQVRSFATDYGTLVDGIRDRIGVSGRIIALNLPNLARLPYRASAPRPEREAVQRAAVGMTTAINALTSRGVRVIDLMCNAALYAPTSLYSDGFHPNDTGYALIAAEVVRAVTASSFPAPQASCALMTM